MRNPAGKPGFLNFYGQRKVSGPVIRSFQRLLTASDKKRNLLTRTRRNFPVLGIIVSERRSFDQTVRSEQELVLLSLIDTQGGDPQMAIFKAFHPPLSFEVPQVELHQFGRSAEEMGHFVLTHARTFHAAPTLHVQQ